MSDIGSTLRRAATVYSASYPPGILAPDPHINTLSPSTVSAAAGATVITVTGYNFSPASVVEVNQAAQATTYVSPTSLTISYDPTVAGTVAFTVRDGLQESNSVSFVVGALAGDEEPEEEPTVQEQPEEKVEEESEG